MRSVGTERRGRECCLFIFAQSVSVIEKKDKLREKNEIKTSRIINLTIYNVTEKITEPFLNIVVKNVQQIKV